MAIDALKKKAWRIWDDDPEGLKEWIGNWKPDNFSLKTAKARFRR